MTETLEDLAGAVASIQAELTEIRECKQVAEVYVKYCRGIDRLDEEAYQASFWPDAQINYGSAESITPGEHWSSHMLAGHRDPLLAWGHVLTNQVIDIDGDTAHVETYLLRLPAPKEKGEQEFVLAGRYVDRVDRRNGEWRIAVREFIPHFSMRVDSNFIEIFEPMFRDSKSECNWGPMGRRDVAFVRPLEKRERTDGPPCATSAESISEANTVNVASNRSERA